MPDQPIRHTKGELNMILANLLRDYKGRDFVLHWFHQKDLPDPIRDCCTKIELRFCCSETS